MMPAALLLLLALCGGVAKADYICEEGRDVMVHLFEWPWDDIANECEQVLGPGGYCAVQISPANEHRMWTEEPHFRPWWERYQPVSYILHSRSGSRSALESMITRCNNAGVKVYADAVINHMTGEGTGYGTAGSYFTTGPGLYGGEEYPAVPYNGDDFNGPAECENEDLNIGDDYHDEEIVRNCRLVGLRDLKLDREYVRDMVVAYLNDLISVGVSGFRIDAAKYMWPHDLEAIISRLANLPDGTRPFVFQEVSDFGDEPIKATDYIHLGRVTEFKYGKELSAVILNSDGESYLAELHNFGEGWGFLLSSDAASFIDNHDNQRGHWSEDEVLTYKQPSQYRMAVGFMLGWDYGYTRVMSSYFFEDTEAGPPMDEDGNTLPVSCFDEWVCEHRWRSIYNMVHFHNLAKGHGVQHWWDNGANHVAFARGSVGFIAMNNEIFALHENLQTGLPAGEYCDVMSCDNIHPPCGEATHCRDPITVAEDGTAEIYISHQYNDFDEVPMIAIHI